MLYRHNCVLQLPVNDNPVGNNDHRVEYVFLRFVIEGAKPMGKPRYCVGLAGTGGMLDKVVLFTPVFPEVCR
jgi:hypothetical protein